MVCQLRRKKVLAEAEITLHQRIQKYSMVV
jgi:hypothetical protein